MRRVRLLVGLMLTPTFYPYAYLENDTQAAVEFPAYGAVGAPHQGALSPLGRRYSGAWRT